MGTTQYSKLAQSCTALLTVAVVALSLLTLIAQPAGATTAQRSNAPSASTIRIDIDELRAILRSYRYTLDTKQSKGNNFVFKKRANEQFTVRGRSNSSVSYLALRKALQRVDDLSRRDRAEILKLTNLVYTGVSTANRSPQLLVRARKSDLVVVLKDKFDFREQLTSNRVLVVLVNRSGLRLDIRAQFANSSSRLTESELEEVLDSAGYLERNVQADDGTQRKKFKKIGSTARRAIIRLINYKALVRMGVKLKEPRYLSSNRVF